MPKILVAAYCALAVIILCCRPSIAAIKTADVPTFKLRARIVSAGDDKLVNKPPKHVFHLGEASARAEGGDWSDWMEFWLPEAQAALKAYPNLYLRGFPVVTHLQVDHATDPTQIEVELQFDENKQIVPLHGELFGPTLGILVWRDADKKPMAGTMADFNRLTYWKTIETVSLPPEQRPRKFPIVDRFIGGDDDRLDWREGLSALSCAGFTAIQVPPSKPIRALLKEAGVQRTAGGVYSPPGYTFADAAPGKKPPQPLDAWAAHEARPYLDAGFAPRDIAWFAMADEPGWYAPSCYEILKNPDALARFHAYLKDQGLQPQDVGSTKWEDVQPLGRSRAVDLPGKRLFYWTQRFFSWDSSRYFAESTRALEKAFYPGLPISTNFNFFAGRFFVPGPVANNPDKKSPDAAMGGHDWLEFGRMRGCTMLWTEDWFGDAPAPQWSFYCAKLRCAADKSGVDFGGYVVPRAGGDREEGLLQKMLCIAGSGGKAINTYTFGPEYNFPGNCYSQRPQLLAKLAEANGMIAAAEDLLWEGHRTRAQVAILMPRSSQAWDLKDQAIAHGISDATNTNMNGATMDYMAETFDLYVALQHANIPVDFVDEDDLATGLHSVHSRHLDQYRVIYVTEPNIPEESLDGLALWAKQEDRRLVLVSGAAATDRYGEKFAGIRDVLAVWEKPRERIAISKLAALKEVGKVKGPGGEALAVGVRVDFNPIHSGEVVAKFDDGSPAIVVDLWGQGVIDHYAWMPGLSYVSSAHEKKDGLPAGFSQLLRDWICRPVTQARVKPPVTASVPMVETPILISEKGAAVTVLNWTGEPIDHLTLHIRVPFKVTSAQAVRGGVLKFEVSGDDVVVTLAVHGADIVMLRP